MATRKKKVIQKSVSWKGKLRIGSRGSRLALVQVKEILHLLSRRAVKFDYEHVIYDSAGDRDKSTPLTERTPDDYFTDALDKALLSGEIDIAIHSAKDLPEDMKKSLEIFALTKSIDATDSFVGRVPIAQLPKGSKIGTSSLVRKQALEGLNPGVEAVSIRGNIDERIAMANEGKIDGVIIATCALKRLGLTKKIKNVLSYEATPLQGQLAITGRSGDVKLKEYFSAIDVRKKFGKVTLVGAGPGDAKLITLKGVECLKKADVVFYDYLIDTRLLNHCKKSKKIYVGKRKGEHALSQAVLSLMLRKHAQAGKDVVRLKGGDPLIFGRGADEIKYLQSYHIDVEVIPGVSSATGIPSLLGIPLTARGISSSVAFVSGHAEDEKSAQPQPVKIPQADTIVFLMGLTKLDVIVQSLRNDGWKDETPIIVISKGTKADEKIACATIATIEGLLLKKKLSPPALIVVGEVVKFWKPRASRQETVLYLGTNPDKYQSLGKIVHLPMIEIAPIKFSMRDRQKWQTLLSQFSMIILTSRFAVKSFFALLGKSKAVFLRLQSMDFAVVGVDTKLELEKHKITPKVVASPETSQGLFAALAKSYDLRGKKILFPRSSLPNPYLKEELIKQGAKVVELPVYTNKKPKKRNFPLKYVNKVLFTSPSTVQNFLADYKSIPQNWQILSKGPYTRKALEEAGYQSEVLKDDEIS